MGLFNRKLPIFRPRRSTFNLSHFNNLTLKMGQLIPIQCIEVAPKDKFRLGVSALGRLMPMTAPVFAGIKARFYHFYAPYRLLWNHADDFFTGGANGKAVQKPLWPKMSTSDFPSTREKFTRSLLGYLSYPYRSGAQFSDMPLRMYLAIRNEYFRNEAIQDELEFDKAGQGYDNSESRPLQVLKAYNEETLLFNRNWKKDYFTAAMPWTQKGNEVLIPLDVTATEFRLVTNQGAGQQIAQQKFLYANYGPQSGIGTVRQTPTARGADDGQGNVISTPQPNATEITFSIVDPQTGRPYEFASNLPVNVLRESLALQKMLERKLRYGSRLVEYLLGVHGVHLSDKTAQRVRYIGGNTINMQIGELLQTSANQTGQPLGQMSGTGYMRGTGNGGKYFCEEYGMIMTIAVVMPEVGYLRHTPKHLLKDDPYDFLLPQFAHLGDQAILNIEVDGEHTYPDEVFGYIGRYDEYRTMVDEVHGDLQLEGMMDWHMYRDLPPAVALNNDFITSQPTTRIFNVQSTNAGDVVMQTYLHTLVQRNLPKYAIPM